MQLSFAFHRQQGSRNWTGLSQTSFLKTHVSVYIGSLHPDMLLSYTCSSDMFSAFCFTIRHPTCCSSDHSTHGRSKRSGWSGFGRISFNGHFWNCACADNEVFALVQLHRAITHARTTPWLQQLDVTRYPRCLLRPWYFLSWKFDVSCLATALVLSFVETWCQLF